ncbi:non-homologous end-joining DNA ligase [Solirubrobacter ginsenosidimutans]|uniref:DNA ligase (ATP) n=1 Tax=Solirubrobacter ginsenosidimutans TaxID=490573 RepID=A0A9X3S654_9ACTN|nr:non-homologous end-joining DNA ligase [Solirubrobacter ginsenosidimutans]MDA0166322.1 non-homologous end-joining DNA ligase [Solirubrobacter ginsenosidimutans]
MADGLDAYRAKRDFDETPEPAGERAPREGELRFVVQEHSARAMHWDLRLEHEGTLASWAVPKGIPTDPKRNNLAVRTEDHPLEYLDFHGEIPAGHYGAGTMKIFDRGTFEVEKWRDAEVMVVFHGERVRGKYVLFKTGGKNWMIHRMDPPEDPDSEPMPQRVAPMLARIGKLPVGENWAYEIKWDGVRAIGYAEGGRLKLESRNANNITARYPELRPLGRALGTHEAILDGEVVALDADGRPSFQRLQRRMHLTSEGMVRRLSQSEPVVYMIFDLLWLDGHSLMELTYDERRKHLAELELTGPTWQAPAHHVGNGAALLEASKAQGLEGLVAKRRDSTYLPGRRSQGWVKVKNVRNTDVVVAGWVGGDGGRLGKIGALVIGFTTDDGELRYAGKVGTGFNEAELKRLQGIVDPLARETSPFTGTQPEKATHFIEPTLVASVDYGDMTDAGTLRHPVYKGLRDDIDPAEVVAPEEP